MKNLSVSKTNISEKATWNFQSTNPICVDEFSILYEILPYLNFYLEISLYIALILKI